MQIIDVMLEQNNLGTAIISNTITVTLEAVEVAVAVEALSVKQLGVYPAEIAAAVNAHIVALDPHTQYAKESDLAWIEYLVTSWTEIDGNFYADVTHNKNKRPVPFQIFNDSFQVVTMPVDCSDLNVLRISSPVALNLIVLVGA